MTTDPTPLRHKPKVLLVMTSTKPGFDGDYLRFRKILPLLSQTNDISLLYLDSDEHSEDFQTFADYFADAERFRYQPQPAGISTRILDFLTLRPTESLQRRDPALLAQLKDLLSELIERKKIDLVLSWVRSTEQFLQHLNVPVIFDLCDALSLQLYQELPAKGSIRQWLYYQRVKRFESEIVANYPVTFVSEKDANWFPHQLDVSIITNGVDLSAECKSTQAQEPGAIVFSGAMSFMPNVKAALYFADEVLPLITAGYPKLRWYVVGTNPTSAILALKEHPNVVVTGTVDSVASYINRAQVVINPMISGSGIKNKVLEAMSLARPVVSTSLGVDGIACANGEHVLIADEPRDFADAVLHLLTDETARQRLANAARHLVATQYTWTQTAKQYKSLFDRLIEHRSTRIGRCNDQRC